jgi:hypothetical protein
VINGSYKGADVYAIEGDGKGNTAFEHERIEQKSGVF